MIFVWMLSGFNTLKLLVFLFLEIDRFPVLAIDFS